VARLEGYLAADGKPHGIFLKKASMTAAHGYADSINNGMGQEARIFENVIIGHMNEAGMYKPKPTGHK
jgi:hypothetical protein